MTSSTATVLAPRSFAEAAAVLAQATAGGHAVRIVGAGTKRGWGHAGPATETGSEIELHTTGLDAIEAHDAGDMTATLQAGVPLTVAQARFAAAGQMLALDPPSASDPAPTIGGIIATGDCGPLRHRYGTPRDLIVGATVALGDGTIARSGGTVIKNVAGYDLAKLFTGAFGTLGLILSVNVRLHPASELSATALGAATDPASLTAAVARLAALPAELQSLDIAWHAGRGRVLARCAGPQARSRAQRLAGAMAEGGLSDVVVQTDDTDLWERQRAGQRSRERALVRVAAAPTMLTAVLRAGEACDATLVGRGGLGESFVELAPDAVQRFRFGLPPGAVVTLRDAPAWARMRDQEPWGTPPAATLALMRQVKDRFDPAHTCNPGLFVGGI